MKRVAASPPPHQEKRQRISQPLTLQDVISSFGNFTCEELTTLAQEVHRVYTNKAALIIQHFPLDLWFVILNIAFEESKVRKLLRNRTVSKAWNRAICSFSTITYSHSVDINKLSTIFCLQALSVPYNALIQLERFTKLKTLSVDPPFDFVRSLMLISEVSDKPDRWSSLSCLTQLTSLSLQYPAIELGNRAIVTLTGLQKLSLATPFVDNAVSRLTNLCSLEVRKPIVIELSQLSGLTKLTSLISNEKEFFVSGTGTYITDTGARYEGSWYEGQLHGDCTLFSVNGHCSCQYHGPFVKNVPVGRGVLVNPLGTKYEGAWVPRTSVGGGGWMDEWFGKQTAHGWGTQISEDGSKSSFAWVGGVQDQDGAPVIDDRHGDGSSLISWIGWESDIDQANFGISKTYHISGVAHFTGKTFRGEWACGAQKDLGTGTFYYQSGEVYEGSIRYGLREGEGVLSYTNGDRYEGEWVGNQRWGKGTMFYSNGEKFEGFWNRDLKHGSGTYFHASGKTSPGNWRHGGLLNPDDVDWDAVPMEIQQ